MNLKRVKTAIAFVLLCMLSACSTASEEENIQSPAEKIATYSSIPGVTGAKTGLIISRQLSSPTGHSPKNRPAATLGIYVARYIAQGTFATFTSALQGIESQIRLVAGQKQVTTNEVYTLMTDYSILLQVDVPDMLNRSEDRDAALDTYTDSLQNYTELLEQKQLEIRTSEEELEEKRSIDKKAVQSLESEIRRSFKNEEFQDAASKQEALAELEGILAKTEIQLKQTADMYDRFTELLKIGNRRLEAIEANRRIILSGLKVIEVPGIEDFELIEK